MAICKWAHVADSKLRLCGQVAEMATTVKLISSDGFEFVVERKAACVSNTIKQMLSADGESIAR